MLLLNRTACLGGWVTSAKFTEHHSFNNQQKVRVDMFMDIINGKEKVPNMNLILPLLVAKNDMSGMYLQSEELKWLKINQKPDLLIMDNFCELVDKKFIYKDGSVFCGYYSDFNKKYFADGTLVDCGLLDINNLHHAYDCFFNYIQNTFNNIKIIFLHFPTTFENRDIYINQGVAITEALEKLSPKYNIQNIHADASEIEQKDNLTYHFSDKTVKNMADKIIWE